VFPFSVERLSCGLDCDIDIFFGGFVNGADDFFVGGVDDFEGFAVNTFNPFVVDEPVFGMLVGSIVGGGESGD
jgi:hypothetical protein